MSRILVLTPLMGLVHRCTIAAGEVLVDVPLSYSEARALFDLKAIADTDAEPTLLIVDGELVPVDVAAPEDESQGQGSDPIDPALGAGAAPVDPALAAGGTDPNIAELGQAAQDVAAPDLPDVAHAAAPAIVEVVPALNAADPAASAPVPAIVEVITAVPAAPVADVSPASAAKAKRAPRAKAAK